MITNVNDLQEGDVMTWEGQEFSYRGIARGQLCFHRVYSIWFWPDQIQDLMDHGIPFRRKVAEGGSDSD